MRHLIEAYRKNVAARGDKPRPVYTLISLVDGRMLGWSINRRESERRAAERGDCKIEVVAI